MSGVDWDVELERILAREVDAPAKGGYFVEALARLDALVDFMVEALLRDRFYAQQGALNAVARVLDPAAFSGAVKAKILLDENVLSPALYKHLRDFKAVRNAASHQLFYKPALGRKTARGQAVAGREELERLGEEKLRGALQKGKGVYRELYRLLAAGETRGGGRTHANKVF